jgi:hypothetical protein
VAARKSVVSTRAQLVNLITKLEQTKKQATVNAMRQAFKRLVLMDAQARLSGRKSPITMLSRESASIVRGVKIRRGLKVRGVYRSRALRKKK